MQKRNPELVKNLKVDFITHDTFWRRAVANMHNVRGYGAVGDGLVDDRQAFADTDAAALARGETAFAPAGVYRISSNITLNANWVFAPGSVFDEDPGVTVTVTHPYYWGAGGEFNPGDYVPITRQIIAGAGLTGGGNLSADRTLNVGAGAGITANADDIEIRLATPSGLTLAGNDLAIADSIAGDGLTISGKVLAVGAGSGVTVDDDSVSVSLGANSGLSLAGDVLALGTPGTLSVSSTNAVTGASHTHAITASANPGAVESLLKTGADGQIALTGLALRHPGGEYATLIPDVDSNLLIYADNNLQLYPNGDVVFSPGGKDVLPLNNYDLNLGALHKKYLTLHAAELWVETLVAQETMATIGGRVLVGPTTTLEEDLSDTAVEIVVKHNQMDDGDVAYLESSGKVEFVRVEGLDITVVSTGNDYFAVPSGYVTLFPPGRKFTVRGSTANDGEWTVDHAEVDLLGTLVYVVENVTSGTADGHIAYLDSGPYTYLVERNLDGTGANEWFAGDAVFNTGQQGDGFIDLYSLRGVAAGSTAGPTIVGNVRGSLGTYNDWKEHWAIGNLNGLYGYGADRFGVGLGKADANNLVLDAVDGIRFRQGATVLASLSGTNWTIGQTTGAHITLTPTDLTLKDNSGATAINLGAAGNLIEKPLMLGTGGGIWQGTGTFASPITGIKLFRSGDTGVLASYNSTNEQIRIDTDGRFKAAAGEIVVDATGITFSSTVGNPTRTSLIWKDGAFDYFKIGPVISVSTIAGMRIETFSNKSLAIRAPASNVTISGYSNLMPAPYLLVGQVAIDLEGGVPIYGTRVDGQLFYVTGDALVAGNINTDGYITASGVTNPRIRMIQHTLANNGAAPLGHMAEIIGWVFITNTSAGHGGLFFCRGGGNAVVQVAVSSATLFSTTAGTANRVNVYYSATNSRYEIQNLIGSTQYLEIMFIAR